MKPYHSIAELFACCRPLSVSFVPILLYCKEIAELCKEDIKQKINIDIKLPTFDKLYNESLLKINESNQNSFTPGLFHYNGLDVIEAGKAVDTISQLVDLLLN